MSVIDEYLHRERQGIIRDGARLTREEGLFVGGSSGLITQVALKIARELDDPKAMVVTILCDTGERYLSKLYSDEWMRENQMLDTPTSRAAQRARQERRRRAGGSERRARSDGAAGDRTNEPARCLSAARDGWRKLCRLGERLVAVAKEPREPQSCSTRP